MTRRERNDKYSQLMSGLGHDQYDHRSVEQIITRTVGNVTFEPAAATEVEKISTDTYQCLLLTARPKWKSQILETNKKLKDFARTLRTVANNAQVITKNMVDAARDKFCPCFPIC